MNVEEYQDSDTAQLSERRDSPRYSVDGDSLVVFVGQGIPITARIVDLSQEGCCIRTNERCSARVRRPVDIGFTVDGAIFRFSGILQWTNGRDLLGIQFVNMIPRRMVELASVICEMEAAATVRTEAVIKLIAEHETQRPVEREANKLAERQNRQPIRIDSMTLSAPREPATSAATTETELQTAHLSTARDRRKSLRHEVDTSATIFLVNVGSTLRGRIEDLSVSGCRIRTDERFPVGIYTRVETEFRMEGLPFRLGGVIQAIHDRNTVGIRFLDLSPRKQEQVVELIDEIDQMHAAQSAKEPAPAQDRL
jgi:hypothetical protein